MPIAKSSPIRPNLIENPLAEQRDRQTIKTIAKSESN